MFICCHSDADSTVSRADTAGWALVEKVPCFRAFQIGGHFSGSVTGDGTGAEGWGMEALEGWIMEMLALVAGETRDKRSLRLGCCYS